MRRKFLFKGMVVAVVVMMMIMKLGSSNSEVQRHVMLDQLYFLSEEGVAPQYEEDLSLSDRVNQLGGRIVDGFIENVLDRCGM